MKSEKSRGTFPLRIGEVLKGGIVKRGLVDQTDNREIIEEEIEEE